MRRIFLCSLFAATIALVGCAANPASNVAINAVIVPADLVGNWKVDLRPTPSAPEYFQQFVVTAVDGKSFTGSFYGAEISEGRINDDWGALRFAFVTGDQSGPYHHSGVLRAHKIEGMTLSIGRNFLAYWSAIKP
jgi:hypothetical protein